MTAKEITMSISLKTGLSVETIESIEDSIDFHSLPKVVMAISLISKAKADYVEENWQAPLNADNRLGKLWANIAKQIYIFSIGNCAEVQHRIDLMPE